MDQLPEIQPLEPRRKEEEKKRSGAAWLFDAGKGAEGLAEGGVGAGAEGGASAFSRSFLGRMWGQLARWLAQGGSIFATAKGRVLVTLLACLTAALNHWFFMNAAAASAAPGLSAPPLFNGMRRDGKAWEEPDLWNSDLSKTPNSVGLVAGGKDMDAAARAAAEAAAQAAAQQAGGPGGMGGPGAMGDAKDAGGAKLPDGKALPNGPDQMTARDGQLAGKLGQMKPWQPTGGSVGSSTALFGGVGKAFNSIKTLALKPFSGQAQTARAAAARPTVSGGKGFGPARRALNQAFGFGRLSRNSGDLGAASTYSGAVFDNSQPAGAAVTGTGAGAPGSSSGGAGIAPGQGAKGDELQSGGPMGGGTNASGTTTPTDPQAVCDQKFPDGGMLATPEGGCAPAAGHQNQTPWQGQSDMASMLTLIATIVLLLAEIIGKLAKTVTWLHMVAEILAMIAAVLGAIIMVQGIMVLAQGQTAQGGIYTLTGAAITAAGVMCAMGEDQHLAGENSANAGSKGFLPNLMGKIFH